MERFLTGTRPPRALFLECNPELLERAGSSRDELLAWLEVHAYEVEWIDEANGRTVAALGAVERRIRQPLLPANGVRDECRA